MLDRFPRQNDTAQATPTQASRRAKRRERPRRAAATTIRLLPTLFTLGNLLCGFFAIFFASRPELVEPTALFGWTPLTIGALLIFLGMAFDGLDGRIARLTRNTSDLGEQLDSMADMVTFGAAPAFLVIQLITQMAGVSMPYLTDRGDTYLGRITLAVAGLYVACAALRLARFNVEQASAGAADHMSFKGLPSPGAAGTIASLVLLHQHYLSGYLAPDEPAGVMQWGMTVTAAAIIVIMVLAALAMVSQLRYVHVLNRFVRGRAKFDYVVATVALLMLLLVWPQQALAAGFVAYALSAPALAGWRRLPTTKSPSPAQATDHKGETASENGDESGKPPAT